MVAEGAVPTYTPWSERRLQPAGGSSNDRQRPLTATTCMRACRPRPSLALLARPQRPARPTLCLRTPYSKKMSTGAPLSEIVKELVQWPLPYILRNFYILLLATLAVSQRRVIPHGELSLRLASLSCSPLTVRGL